MHCDERSAGHVPFHLRCATLRWTLHARRRYCQTTDTTVTSRGMVSLDCRSIIIVVGVAVYVLLYVSVLVTRRSQRHHHRQRIGHLLMATKNQQLKRVYFDPKRVASYGGVNGVDASRACRIKSSKNGCRNRTPIPYTNRRELISGDDALSWEVDFSSGRPVSSTCRI